MAEQHGVTHENVSVESVKKDTAHKYMLTYVYYIEYVYPNSIQKACTYK